MNGLELLVSLAALLCLKGCVRAIPCDPGQHFPHPLDCSAFYLCDKDGNPQHFSCPEDLYFNPYTSTCDWFENVICINSNNQTNANLEESLFPGNESAVLVVGKKAEEENFENKDIPSVEEISGGGDIIVVESLPKDEVNKSLIEDPVKASAGDADESSSEDSDKKRIRNNRRGKKRPKSHQSSEEESKSESEDASISKHKRGVIILAEDYFSEEEEEEESGSSRRSRRYSYQRDKRSEDSVGSFSVESSQEEFGAIYPPNINVTEDSNSSSTDEKIHTNNSLDENYSGNTKLATNSSGEIRDLAIKPIDFVPKHPLFFLPFRFVRINITLDNSGEQLGYDENTDESDTLGIPQGTTIDRDVILSLQDKNEMKSGVDRGETANLSLIEEKVE